MEDEKSKKSRPPAMVAFVFPGTASALLTRSRAREASLMDNALRGRAARRYFFARRIQGA
jgi:hypothetical protein